MAKIRTLVVDDDTLMRELLKAILRDEGYLIVGEAKDGAAAVAACEKSLPDLVCLDVNMPGMSGIDTLRVLHGKYPEMCVVMITGDSSLSTVREAVSHGAAGYIIKPFTHARVADALKAALKQAQSFQ